ncbi:MAG: NPCBM/NEW2 domain-containing protein [Bifidobacterium bifidum]
MYDVSGLGASRFEAYVGVDRELTGVDRDHANVDFQVMIDGEVVFEKTAMQHDTPMAKVSVDIPEGAKTITLAVGAGSETWGDHADWADARFVGVEMPEAPQVTGLAVTGEGVKDGKLDMTVGQSVGLGVTVTPEDAVDQSVTWTVAGDAVSVGEDGTVKALKVGTATVTVASVAVPSVTASVTVTVTEKADPDPDPKPDPDPILTRRRSLILTRIPTESGSGRRAGTTTPGDGQKPNTDKDADKDADKNAGKDKNQSIAATGTSIVPVGVLAVSMMAAGCR